MPIPTIIPGTIPGSVVSGGGGAPPATADPFSLYDIAIGGVGFEYASTTDNPMQRVSAPFEKQRIDQAKTPGEQTLDTWWLRSQDSFHGGAGQLMLEPAFPTPYDEVRFDQSKNVDVFTPGQVTRLPDTTLVETDVPSQMCAVVHAGNDAIVYLTGTTVKLFDTVTSGVSTFTAGSAAILSIATDGTYVYAASATDIWKCDPANVTSSTKVATYPAAATTGPVISWQKSRLMLGVSGAVYQVDVSQVGVTLGVSQLLYQHPSPAFTWRCFATSPTAVLAGGDAAGQSSITQFVINQVAGAPTLQVGGDIGDLPVGERLLSMKNVMGTYLALGTSKGVRIGQFDSYWSRLTYGPLELLPTDPTIPCVGLISRDRFVYAVGQAYDEAGLIRVDLGTKVDQAGRYAWAADLISPTVNTTTATCAVTLSQSGRIAFGVTGQGILLEGVGPGVNREAWIRTSRIRWGTTEPKLFKLGRLRGNFATSEIAVTAITPTVTQPLITVGFQTTDPSEFRLPTGQQEWMQLKLQLIGSTSLLRSYQVKALPGTHKQRQLKFVLAIYDTETTKTGARIRDLLSARGRLNALEALDTVGDEVLLQEFTPAGVISTVVVIEQVSYTQIGRPNRRTDLGGTVTVVLRTVEE